MKEMERKEVKHVKNVTDVQKQYMHVETKAAEMKQAGFEAESTAPRLGVSYFQSLTKMFTAYLTLI